MKYISFLIIIIFFNSCVNTKEEDIKIGFVAGLSGKYSALGTSIRDGFTLAFEEIDYMINNQKVEIIQKDDKQDENEAKKAIEYFLQNDIKLIVGNTTSSMSKVSYQIIDKQTDTLLISPTASSNYFNKKDDNFLRIQVENSDKKFKGLIEYVKKNKNIVFIYDSKNQDYSSDYEKFFKKELQLKWQNSFVEKFDINEPYKNIVENLKIKKIDLIVVIANSIDSANIIQYLKVNDIKGQILASGWAKTKDFISNGGRAVEDVLFSTEYDENSKDIDFLKFRNLFMKTYNKEPSAIETQGYELGKILINKLSKSSDISTLKQRILKQEIYKGLQGNITFDKYGDVTREYFMMKVKNAKYVRIEE
ncbi:hypothetical protein LPB137_05905 [Poseidonibacter parvus]|uniref:Leucine-binding protein domain-containing protein n=1 Tax=Poseidonibacter parvus TaxID=1850254 RepID=A0A1P8KLG6_9BACT|nr:ABC transporter substrate-binding protein [Poseidonibacter parvus]APW65413.1 hypothetical protein LPB137_05905 [Poseidonibacter parvus]